MATLSTPLTRLAFALSALTFGEASAHPDPTLFAETAFIQAPEVVDCTLEDGTETLCHRITVGYLPEGLEIGPFCPLTLDDTGGIWEWTGENAGLYRVDREFLLMLDGLGYRFFDEDGTVHIADIATAQPDHDHACINVSADESVQLTMLLPVSPVMAEKPTALGVVSKVGVALDGVPIFSDAPQIQQTGHMPALDVCGGHIDPGGWYHWHATSTDIETVFAAENVTADCLLNQDSAALFGYAFDGFPLFGSTEVDGAFAVGLDACNGHVGDTVLGETYHYHASKDFPNLPACLVGKQARTNFSTTATAGVGAMRAGEGERNEPPRPAGRGSGRSAPGGMPPGFEEAARQLGVSAEVFAQAMDGADGPHADLAVVAKTLDVTVEELRNALPPLPQPPR